MLYCARKEFGGRRRAMLSSFKSLTKFELCLWLVSAAVILISGIFIGNDAVTTAASLIGVTALIFIAKGDVLGQILTIVFSLLYAYISYKFRYWGEMITYAGMTLPSAAVAVYTWIKNPYSKHEVKVSPMTRTKAALVVILTAAVTAAFYFILRALKTPNLIWSTVSIATSFSAAFLLILRNRLYAICYAANDLVLIVLWILATIDDISYFVMIVCFVIFFVNDIYGFISWRKMARRQIMNEIGK